MSDYELLPVEEQRKLARDALHTLERDHFTAEMMVAINDGDMTISAEEMQALRAKVQQLSQALVRIKVAYATLLEADHGAPS